MQPADLAAWIEPSDAVVSPDGSQVAFVVSTVDMDANKYRSGIWVAATDGSAAARPLTTGEHRDSKPRWSPDGTQLAFVSHREEPGSELYVLATAGGEARRLTSWTEECEELVWSPSGDRLAVVVRERDEEQYAPEHDRDRPPRRQTIVDFRLDGAGFTLDRLRHVWTVALADGAVRKVTSGPFHHSSPTWVDDGTIVCSGQRTAAWDTDDIVDLYSFRSDGSGEPERLTSCGGTHWTAEAGPDGALAFVHSNGKVWPSHGQVAVPDERDLTTSLDRNCTRPRWDGYTILFAADDHGAVPLRRVDPATGEITTVIGGDRRVTSHSAAAGVVAATVASSDGFTQVVVVDAAGERALTSFQVPFPISVPEHFTCGDVDGWLV